MEQKDDATTNGARGRATQAVTPRTPGRVEWASVRAATVLLQRSAGPQVAGPLVFVLEAVDVEAEQAQGGLSGPSHG